VPGNDVSSVASPCTAASNLLKKTVLFFDVTTFLRATGMTHGIKGLFGTPFTVSGGIALCKNFKACLFTNTLGDTKAPDTGFAGYVQGPLIDVVSGVTGPTNKGIYPIAIPLIYLDEHEDYPKPHRFSHTLHALVVCNIIQTGQEFSPVFLLTFQFYLELDLPNP
jgi:hypothetical protein